MADRRQDLPLPSPLGDETMISDKDSTASGTSVPGTVPRQKCS